MKLPFERRHFSTLFYEALCVVALAFLGQEVEVSGFKFVEHADSLSNSLDPRDKNTPKPSQPKGEFLLKSFRQ